ncbi:MAG: hemerythrin domain-containing protein [Prevotellaceae bacterium]|jgi:regulator of cell morphogenesis and NO signaling|nr:hemerythrin domain-containing protein [Prevotellaceae bacterium]
MYKLGKYNAGDTMSSLITENYRMLLVISRFGIALGFGDKTIGDVCLENHVDVATFLVIVNMLLDEDGATNYAKAAFSVKSLISYLRNSHEYFLNFRLPAIRADLKAILHKGKDELSQAILHYFDEYVAEVRKHMAYEEETVFPYVRALLAGQRRDDYAIAVFRRQHDHVSARLTEFKNIIIKYYPAKSTNEINSVLFDIFNCETDLASHNAIEDHLFVPAIVALENKNTVKV